MVCKLRREWGIFLLNLFIDLLKLKFTLVQKLKRIPSGTGGSVRVVVSIRSFNLRLVV